MFKSKHKRNFTTVGQYIESASNMQEISNLVSELGRITDIIHDHIPAIRDICHCGAIDYEDDLLVIFVNSNVVFHSVNNQIANIQDCLYNNQIRFSKILIKVLPNTQNFVTKKRKELTVQQYLMLEKFAEAINRPDLLKPRLSAENNDEDWQVKL